MAPRGRRSGCAGAVPWLARPRLEAHGRNSRRSAPPSPAVPPCLWKFRQISPMSAKRASARFPRTSSHISAAGGGPGGIGAKRLQRSMCEPQEDSCRPGRWGLGHPGVAGRRRGDERTGGVRAHPGLVARGGTRPCPLVDRLRTDRRSPRRARQQHGVRRWRPRRGHPDPLCVVLLPWATAPGIGARVLRGLLPRGRTGPARASSPRRPAVPHHRSLHRGGTENLRDIQRAAGPRSGTEQHQRAPGRTQRLAHRLGRQRPGRRGWLVVRPARLDPASPAPYPSGCTRSAVVGRGRCFGCDADGAARHDRVGHRPARWARADRGGERPRPGCAADRRRSVRQERLPVRPHAGGRRRTPRAVDASAAAVRGSGRRRGRRW